MRETEIVLGIEHLWRELTAIYVLTITTDRFNQYNLPRLAAIHLLDGFAIELIDGETTQISVEWLQAISAEITVLLHDENATYFVLSIIGVQSSGKSTLLNTMYGCRLRTNLLLCTRGGYIQLIRCEDRSYNYVLLIDIEGVRSGSFQLRTDRFLHDNRLCTMAMMIAHKTIVMTTANQMIDMASILSMVRNATKQTGMEWRDPIFVERGAVVIGQDEIEINQHNMALKDILINAQVYDAQNFNFVVHHLPTNIGTENAIQYGCLVSEL